MDRKDLKLLAELDKNARLSYAQIAKKTGIAQETVRYRIQKFIDEGVIQEFVTHLNSTKFGYSYYELFIKFQQVTEKIKRQLIEYLQKSTKITWIAEFEGNYDLGIIFVVKNQKELEDLMVNIQKKFGSIIMKKDLAINLSGEFLYRNYLLGEKRKEILSESYDVADELIKLDDVDKKICVLLASNSRINAVKISQKINCSSDTVLQRMKNLKKSRIINRFTIVPNPKKIGRLHFKILFFMKDTDENLISSFLQHIRMDLDVISIVKTLSNWDYEIDLEVNSLEDLRLFKSDLINEFSKIISDHQTIQIVKTWKFNFLPLSL